MTRHDGGSWGDDSHGPKQHVTLSGPGIFFYSLFLYLTNIFLFYLQLRNSALRWRGWDDDSHGPKRLVTSLGPRYFFYFYFFFLTYIYIL